jgi:hypothetical protein
MKKVGLLIIGIVLFSSIVLAESGLEVTSMEKNNVVIAEIGNSAFYELTINNLGNEEDFKIFTLVGIDIEPSDYFALPKGESVMSIEAKMGEKILSERRGLLSFEYQIKGKDRDLFKDKFLVDIVSLSDALDVSYAPIYPNDTSVEFVVSNKEPVEIKDLSFVFDSAFFRDSESFDLGADETKTFSVSINKEGVEKLVAGPYIVSTTVVVGDSEVQLDGVIDYLEKEGISVDESSKGIISRTTSVTKTNRGNTPVTATVIVKKNALTRLFTTSSVEPTDVIRSGFIVEYVWRKSIVPDESLIVKSTTNYIFPFLIIVAIVGLGWLARVYYFRAVSISKKTSLVRTKGGEFALRVVLKVRAGKSVSNIQLTDFLPAMAKLYDNFGKKPDKVDSSMRRLHWNVGSLRMGEERVYSYVMYSKLNVVGRFELPLASATFERNEQTRQVLSNKAFFAAEKS